MDHYSPKSSVHKFLNLALMSYSDTHRFSLFNCLLISDTLFSCTVLSTAPQFPCIHFLTFIANLMQIQPPPIFPLRIHSSSEQNAPAEANTHWYVLCNICAYVFSSNLGCNFLEDTDPIAFILVLYDK